MAKQTAVEWLLFKMLENDSYKIWPSLLERAKNMEKEDIQRAYYEGYYDANNKLPKHDEYYKENYED